MRNLVLEGSESDLVNGSRGILVGWKAKDVVLAELEKLLEKYSESGTEKERWERSRTKQKISNLSRSSITDVPVVKFRNGQRISCVPEKFSYEILNVGECTRLQVSTEFPGILNCLFLLCQCLSF